MEGSSYFLRADRETGSAGLFLSFLSLCHWGYMCRKHRGQGGFQAGFSQTPLFQGNIPWAPQSPMGRAFSPAGSVGAIRVPLAHRTPFSPGMRKGGKRIRWAGRLTRQAKSSCKQACGCISMAVRVAFFNAGQWHQETTCSLASLLFSHSGSFFFIQQRNSLPDRRKPDKLEG